ncbi:hypothetical protein F7725_023358 [Dissostichus mawsoni]|uniref:THAP9-like helix-turn-helix domain-containing protein n=1 Tax=Dissostichus mawsoni TaxID=36200 RepID=A0A7J5Z1H1_DISMA|nr:hypothetical protein F7725_023358 [Dissostichus mawsoni]
MRKKWEVALRREGFTASESSVICSEHFKQDEFDRTGQIDSEMVLFPPSSASRFTSKSSRKRAGLRLLPEKLKRACLWPLRTTQKLQPHTHNLSLMIYVLPASPTALKARLNEALARVESLERERKNAMAREKRANTTVRSLLGDLREKNLINEELKERLDFYSDLQIDFKAKQGHEYSKDHREFVLTLHLHGPKAYKYLRETKNVAVFGGWQAAERVIRQASTRQAPKVSTVTYIVREEIGTEDVF